MQTQNKLFDDMAKMASGAASTLLDARKEMENMFRQQFESFASRMNMVTRDEFEVVREMAQEARMQVEALRAEIETLRGSAGEKKPAAARKAAPKKPASTKPSTGTSTT